MVKVLQLSENMLFSIFDQWKHDNQIPTASLLVKCGDCNYHYMSGYTRIGGDRLITNHSLFEAGSITKTFIAVLIMKLVEKGKLHLSDNVGKYLAKYYKWQNASIEQLLSMTSNVANYFYDDNFKDQIYNNKNPNYDTESLLELAHNSDTVTSGCGEWYYSNTNYLILGKIIELVACCSLSEILTKWVLEPFCFENTYYSDTKYPEYVMCHKVHGYYNDLDVTSTLPSNYGATGSMLMNAHDIEHLVNLLFVEKHMLKPCSLNRMLQGNAVPYTVGRPANTEYGLGVFITEDKATGKMIWHTGLTPGYSSSFIYLPNYSLTIVGQINRLQGVNLKITNHDLLFPNGTLMQQIIRAFVNK
jgi:D-alanyl-D-alanine carboxypeptidase